MYKSEPSPRRERVRICAYIIIEPRCTVDCCVGVAVLMKGLIVEKRTSSCRKSRGKGISLMSETRNDFILNQMSMEASSNYGQLNITAVRESLQRKRQNQTRSKQVYTMIQVNSPCEVTISDESKRICASALMK